MNVPLRTGDEFGILLRQKKQRSLPERQIERKYRCLRLPRHTGYPRLKYGKASATTSRKTKSTRTPSLVSPYEKTGDSRFAPNLLPYTGVRAVFFGVTCTVVRKVYGRHVLISMFGAWRKRFSACTRHAVDLRHVSNSIFGAWRSLSCARAATQCTRTSPYLVLDLWLCDVAPQEVDSADQFCHHIMLLLPCVGFKLQSPECCCPEWRHEPALFRAGNSIVLFQF